jgi:hypothetical protein
MRAIEPRADFPEAAVELIHALRAVGHDFQPVQQTDRFSSWRPAADDPAAFGLFIWLARPQSRVSWARSSGLARAYDHGGVARLAADLAAGADPNECDPLGVPIICDAASRGDVDALALLLDRGVDIESSCAGTTPLIYAANAGHEHAIRFLLARGADRHATNDEGYTAAGRVPASDEELVALLRADE